MRWVGSPPVAGELRGVGRPSPAGLGAAGAAPGSARSDLAAGRGCGAPPARRGFCPPPRSAVFSGSACGVSCHARGTIRSSATMENVLTIRDVFANCSLCCCLSGFYFFFLTRAVPEIFTAFITRMFSIPSHSGRCTTSQSKDLSSSGRDWPRKALMLHYFYSFEHCPPPVLCVIWWDFTV